MAILEIRDIESGYGEVQILWGTSIALEEGKLTGFALHYQPAAKPSQASGGYSWRRRPSAA